MKFKVLKGCELFERLVDLKNKMQIVQRQATELVESLGYTRHCPARYKLAGGVSAIEFPTADKVKGWVKVTNQNKRLHMPSSSKDN